MASASDVDATQVQASTGITPKTLTAILKDKLQAIHVDIHDMSGKSETGSIRMEIKSLIR